MLLDSIRFRNEITSSVSRARKTFTIASAFLKIKALEGILSGLSDSVTVEVVARWQARDLLSGASDLSVYEYCRDNNIKFGISLNFHGKLYILDRQDVFLGSANLTSRGFSFGRIGNIEFGTYFHPRDEDLLQIEKFISQEVIWLNDRLFNEISSALSVIKSEENIESSFVSWPSALQYQLKRPVKYLWIEELMFSEPEALLNPNFDDTDVVHDLTLLGLGIDEISNAELRNALKKTRYYKWLLFTISDSGSVNIGKLSAALHSSLLDDPTPYRKEVKSFVVTAFKWLEYISETFQVTQHRVTKSVTVL